MTSDTSQLCEKILPSVTGFIARRRSIKLTMFRSSLVFAKWGENILIYSTTPTDHRAEIDFQGGIGVPGMPNETERNKSTSVGRWLGAVERKRKLA